MKEVKIPSFYDLVLHIGGVVNKLTAEKLITFGGESDDCFELLFNKDTLIAASMWCRFTSEKEHHCTFEVWFYPFPNTKKRRFSKTHAREHIQKVATLQKALISEGYTYDHLAANEGTYVMEKEIDTRSLEQEIRLMTSLV